MIEAKCPKCGVALPVHMEPDRGDVLGGKKEWHILNGEDCLRRQLDAANALLSQVCDHVASACVDVGEDLRETPNEYDRGKYAMAETVNRILHDDACRQINLYQQAAEQTWAPIVADLKAANERLQRLTREAIDMADANGATQGWHYLTCLLDDMTKRHGIREAAEAAKETNDV